MKIQKKMKMIFSKKKFHNKKKLISMISNNKIFNNKIICSKNNINSQKIKKQKTKKIYKI